MESKTLTCIGCPMGCQVTIEYEVMDGKNVPGKVTGNTCPRGEQYAISEITNPTRTVTGTVGISNREGIVVSVKTKDSVPKSSVAAVAAELGKITVEAPVKIGDVIVENILGTGSSLVATKNID